MELERFSGTRSVRSQCTMFSKQWKLLAILLYLTTMFSHLPFSGDGMPLTLGNFFHVLHGLVGTTLITHTVMGPTDSSRDESESPWD